MSPANVNQLALVGISHSNSPLQIREKLSITNDDAPLFLEEICGSYVASEAVVLSTCNRTEIYCMTDDPSAIRKLTAARGGSETENLESFFYLKRGRDMIKHAFSVASGLDSMILGEPEILGQMKKAYLKAREGGYAGPSLTTLFERTFNVAKLVRTNTIISHGSVSAPAICAKLAQSVIGDLDKCKVLCIGSGTITKAALDHFATHKVSSITLANRTMSNIESLGKQYGAKIIAYEDIKANLAKHDIIITATSSTQPVITTKSLKNAIKLRKNKPIVIFDLAMPRDVEPNTASLEDIFIYTIDDVGNLATENMGKRRTAIKQASTHIKEATEDLVIQVERNLRDTVKGFKTRLEDIRDDEKKRALTEIRNGKDPAQVIEELARRLSAKIAHEPISSLSNPRSSFELVEEIDRWYRSDE